MEQGKTLQSIKNRWTGSGVTLPVLSLKRIQDSAMEGKNTCIYFPPNKFGKAILAFGVQMSAILIEPARMLYCFFCPGNQMDIIVFVG